MNRYIATFYTHYAALSTARALQRAGVSAEMSPVPRALSADCGACVRYQADTPCEALLHTDFDRVVLAEDGDVYQTVVKNNAP